MNISLPTSTWSWLAVMAVVFVVFIIQVFRFKKTDKLIHHRRTIEFFPTFISTLGVLGTFYGITIGLLRFNPVDLNSSIPGLLDGLKTAFFTSLAGMVGSMVLSAIISRYEDENEEGSSDINWTVGLIRQIVQQMTSQNEETIRSLHELESLLHDGISSFQGPIRNIVNSVDSVDDKIRLQISHVGSIDKQVQHFKTILDEEVDQVKESMNNTNELLERKFDVFTELLKKSNTEALVEVMKKVTVEFQKQMNALINKLIQENFDQLNKSVEQLNKWQQENKEMIISLTSQYREMSINFEGTSTSLTRVKDDTATLVSEGGKLRQIVDSLNRVIVQDEKFIQTADHLHKTAELSKTNMEAFEESTRALNEWVRKQKNFVEGVTLLINKLDEISKIKDYNEEFWEGTKKNLNDGVGLLNTTASQLRASLTDIDKQFYSRLNATLANLDSCIQAMVTGRNR